MRTHTHTHTHIYIYIYIYTYCVYIYIYKYIYILCVCKRERGEYINSLSLSHTHTHIYIYIHLYIYAWIFSRLSWRVFVPVLQCVSLFKRAWTLFTAVDVCARGSERTRLIVNNLSTFLFNFFACRSDLRLIYKKIEMSIFRQTWSRDNSYNEQFSFVFFFFLLLFLFLFVLVFFVFFLRIASTKVKKQIISSFV